MSINDTRRLMISRREAIAPSVQKIAAQQLADHIIQLSIYQRSQHIAVYWAMGGEISLHPLIEHAWEQNKQCYLPVVHRQSMTFIPYFKNTIVRKNRFGIPEPVNDENAIPATELDLVLTPLVAFDRYCHRIGMGGGYYDRTFAFLKEQKNCLALPLNRDSERPSVANPYLMGVAHECQQADSIEPEPWDVTLNSICTSIGQVGIDQSN